MSVPVRPARMEPNVLMDLISTHVIVLKVTRGSTVRMTSMSATQILATTAHAKMVWPPLPVIATLVTLAACAKPTSTSVSASHVRTEAPARTERTHTSVHAPKALRDSTVR